MNTKLDDINRYGIIPFNGTNFDNWKFRMESVLRAAEVLERIEGSDRNEAWLKRNNRARNLIIQNVSDSHLEYIKDIDEASDMMEKLENIFAKKGTC